MPHGRSAFCGGNVCRFASSINETLVDASFVMSATRVGGSDSAANHAGKAVLKALRLGREEGGYALYANIARNVSCAQRSIA